MAVEISHGQNREFRLKKVFWGVKKVGGQSKFQKEALPLPLLLDATDDALRIRIRVF